MRKINKKIIIFLVFLIILFSITIYIIMANNSNNINIINNEKVHYEIKFLDTEIINMSNSLNNFDNIFNFSINWIDLKNNTEKLYKYWNSTILDLNYLSINKESLTEFGKILDELSLSIKNQNKEDTLYNLAKLYKKITQYYESLNYDNNYKNVLYAKYNLLISYSICEKQNWTLVYENILKSDKYLVNIVNSLYKENYNQYNINQAYIAVKELENIINIKDLDIYFVKYKIAMNSLQSI